MFFKHQNVETPYGKGIYLGPSENPDIIKVQPTGWTMARETKPTFFMNPKDVRATFTVGSAVFLTYGEGVITEFRETDSMYLIKLSDWKLAQGQSPSLFLQESALSLVPLVSAFERTNSKKLAEPERPRISYADTCIANAIAIKEDAGKFYKMKDYAAARDKYSKALEAVQYLGESLSNEQKAIVFEQTVPCHNNISLCCMQMKSYTESALFARNGIMLISALEERMDGGQVWQCLQDRGMTKTKQIKEWKTKSYFLAGKAELLRKEYDASINHLESGLALCANDPQSSTDIVKLKDLLATATKKRTAELKKEKSTWSKAFQKNNEIPEKVPEPVIQAEVENKDVRSVEEILKEMRKGSKIESNAVPPAEAKTKTKASPVRSKQNKQTKKAVKVAAKKEQWDDVNEDDDGFDDGYGDTYDDDEDEEEDGESGARRSNYSGNNDSVSDETFGWIIGASAVLGVIGAAAFLVLRARQR